MRIAALLLIFSAAVYSAAGQDSVKVKGITPPKLAVKWSPYHLIYFYPSAQVSLEHRLLKNLQVHYDFGWILHYEQTDSEDYANKRGYRALGELRYYLPSPAYVPFYLAGEFYYHQIQFDRSEVMGFDCAGDCDYFEYVTYKMETVQQGIGFKFGVLLFPGWKRNKSFFFDLQGGLAYRWITYADSNKPVVAGSQFFDNDETEWYQFRPSNKDHSAFRPVIGIRFGYRIW